MSENPEEKTSEMPPAPAVEAPREPPPELVVAPSVDSSEVKADAQLPVAAVPEFPITNKADKINPPLSMEEKKKVWTKRIIGAIVFFAVLGSLALLAAAQAVSFMFKTILTP